MPDDEFNEESDLLADLLDEEIAATEDNKENANNSELEAKVKELETANAGLLKAKQSETRKRQDSADRLNQLEGAVGTLLSQRQQQGMESVSESQAADAQNMGIPVNYDEDGNGWIDPQALSSLTSPYEQRIQNLEVALQRSNAQNSAVTSAEKIKQSIIGENEQFGPASGRYRAARKWVEDKVSEYAKSNGITDRVISSGEALDKAFKDSYLRDEFNSEFEGLKLMDIVTAEDSEEHFRTTLDNIAATATVDLQTPKEKMDSRFQKVLNKPSNLGGQANAKAGQLSILDRVNSLSTTDIMDYSDEQIDTLMKLMGKE